MRHLMGLVLAGGLVLGQAGPARSQFSLSIGNPYTGQGITIGQPNVGYPGYGTSGYSPYAGAVPGYSSPGYSPYAGAVPGYSTYTSSVVRSYPGVTTYNSGYGGYLPGSTINYYPGPANGYSAYSGYMPYGTYSGYATTRVRTGVPIPFLRGYTRSYIR